MLIETERLIITEFTMDMAQVVQKNSVDEDNKRFVPDNKASIRVLEKNGYLKEGLLHHYPFGREFHNVVVMAVVRD